MASLLRRLSIIGYLVAGLAWGAGESDYFDQAREFPNHFLPKNFASLSASDQQKAVAQRRHELELAVSSICDRMMVPIVAPGERNAKPVKYFEYVNRAATEIDASAKVMPSGGVIRSILGYLYEKLHDSAEKNPTQDPFDAVRDIAKASTPIDAFEIRGIGGDFDVLVSSKPDAFRAIQTRVQNITNSVEESLGARNDKTALKRLLFTVGDVKFYDEQTNRSVSQGGASIDFLAFDTHDKKFVEPPNHDYIVDDFLHAKFRYLAPASTNSVEDAQKQTIRGIRPLLELPFLSVADDTQLKNELHELSLDIESGKRISPKATEQVGKAIRNARWALGNNRIVRGRPDSLESSIEELSTQLHKRSLPHFPEYVPVRNISNRDPIAKTELAGFPKELLTPAHEFIKNQTEDGYLSHGTPSLDNAMAIMRGGLFLSGGHYKQGSSMEESGGYAGATQEKAKNFHNGFMLKLKLLDDPRINIFQLTKANATHPFIQEAQKKAESLGLDFNRYLSLYHGIDIIKKNAVLIQNMKAIELGSAKEKLTLVINSTRSAINSKSRTDVDRARAANEFLRLGTFGRSLGIDVENIDDEISSAIANAVRPEVSEIDSIGDNLPNAEEQRAMRKVIYTSLDTLHDQQVVQIAESFLTENQGTTVAQQTLEKLRANFKADTNITNSEKIITFYKLFEMSGVLNEPTFLANLSKNINSKNFLYYPWNFHNQNDRNQFVKNLAGYNIGKTHAELQIIERLPSLFASITSTPLDAEREKFLKEVIESFRKQGLSQSFLTAILNNDPTNRLGTDLKLRALILDEIIKEEYRVSGAWGLRDFPWDFRNQLEFDLLVDSMNPDMYVKLLAHDESIQKKFFREMFSSPELQSKFLFNLPEPLAVSTAEMPIADRINPIVAYLNDNPQLRDTYLNHVFSRRALVEDFPANKGSAPTTMGLKLRQGTFDWPGRITEALVTPEEMVERTCQLIKKHDYLASNKYVNYLLRRILTNAPSTEFYYKKYGDLVPDSFSSDHYAGSHNTNLELHKQVLTGGALSTEQMELWKWLVKNGSAQTAVTGLASPNEAVAKVTYDILAKHQTRLDSLKTYEFLTGNWQQLDLSHLKLAEASIAKFSANSIPAKCTALMRRIFGRPDPSLHMRLRIRSE